MTSLASTEALYAELAQALGVPALTPDANGALQLTVGDDTPVMLFEQSDGFVLLAAPAVALPKQPDYATTLWLLRRNFYDSDLAPFRIAADDGGTLVLWGRVPINGLSGEALAGLIDAVAGEANRIRDEVHGD